VTRVIRKADGDRALSTYDPSMDPRASAHLRRLPVADVALAAVLLLLGTIEVLATAEVPNLQSAPLVAISAAALAWRRRAPLAATGVVMSITVITSLVATPIDSLIVVIPVFALAIYSLGAYAASRRAAVGLVLSVVAVWIATFAEDGPGVDNLAFGLVVAGGPWLAGWMVRRRTEQAVALALRAQELEGSQADRERAAVAGERDRIARELHDIISHSVSVMTIQAGAIEEVLDREPEEARRAAVSIRHTGREALDDLRRLLGVLRDAEHDTQALTPQPGLADLEVLLASVRLSGLDVRFTVDGTPRPLPPAVDLSAFRVVQEALTNTLKHARATVASVGVRYGTDTIDIEVTDDGVPDTGAHDDRTSGGHGLVGMRERVALYGGELDYGRAPAGGFRVHALLPADGGRQ
jgi:signal transduction histidine kinase